MINWYLILCRTGKSINERYVYKYLKAWLDLLSKNEEDFVLYELGLNFIICHREECNSCL